MLLRADWLERPGARVAMHPDMDPQIRVASIGGLMPKLGTPTPAQANLIPQSSNSSATTTPPSRIFVSRSLRQRRLLQKKTRKHELNSRLLAAAIALRLHSIWGAKLTTVNVSLRERCLGLSLHGMGPSLEARVI